MDNRFALLVQAVSGFHKDRGALKPFPNMGDNMVLIGRGSPRLASWSHVRQGEIAPPTQP